jgi:hypothetical protein
LTSTTDQHLPSLREAATWVVEIPPPLVVVCVVQARGLGVQELQCQAWGGSADALEASALALLELDPDFITVSICACRMSAAAAAAATTAIVRWE